MSFDVTSFLMGKASGGGGGGGGGGDDPFALTTYIECSGTQWINTGYIVKDNSIFDIVYAESATQQTFPCLMGVRDNDFQTPSSAKRCTFFPRHGNFGSGAFAWGTSDTAIGQPAWMYANTKKKHLKYSKGNIYLSQEDGNGIIYNFASSASASVTNTIYLFALNQGGADYGAATHFSGKLYRCRIFEGSTLVHEFLPWQENGVACLRDTVTGNIKDNSGTGTFVYGEDA